MSEGVKYLLTLDFLDGNNGEFRTWLISRIRAHGLEALDVEDSQICVVGAKEEKLLQLAKVFNYRRPNEHGLAVEFMPSEFDLTECDIFSRFGESELQSMVFQDLQEIRASADDSHLIGYPELTLYEGKPIIVKCINRRLLSVVPLHDKELLKPLEEDWYRSRQRTLSPLRWLQIPVERIRQYFGETVAFYFSFLHFYTLFMLFPAVLAVIITGISLCCDSNDAQLNEYIGLFAILNMIWSTVFLKLWKRKSNRLAYQWGTYRLKTFTNPRPQFKGELRRCAITHRVERYYPAWRRYVRYAIVTVPVISACTALAIVVMFFYHGIESKARDYVESRPGMNVIARSFILYSPSVLYSVTIIISSLIYRPIAAKITYFENHKYDESFSNHLIAKLVLFDFTNTFVNYFYCWIVMNDLNLLKAHLISAVITEQLINQLIEVGVPYLKKRAYKKRHQRQSLITLPDIDQVPITGRDLQMQLSLPNYDHMSAFDDYLELFLRFGYSSLFSPVFPFTSVFVFINNLFEMQSDGFKLCRVVRRPIAERSSGIGAWQTAFEVTGWMSVVTNAAILCLLPGMRKNFAYLDDCQYQMLFVAFAACLLLIKVLLNAIIDDVPDDVKEAESKAEFIARRALLRQLHDARERKVNARTAEQPLLPADHNEAESEADQGAVKS